MEALISVIIPIYNMEQYLARCLDSVLNNTYRNLEVLCVDDGSTDSSAEILRAYAEKDSRIVPIFKENGGVSSARNAGLDRMTGEYVTFVDPDDYVHPQYVELLYRALKESGTSISICGFQRVDIDEWQGEMETVCFEPGFLQTYALSRLFCSHELRSYCWGKLIPAESAWNVRFHENIHYAEDSVFFAEVCANGKPAAITFFPTPLYFYAQRGDSLASSTDNTQQILVARAFFENLNQPGGRDEIFLDQAIKRSLSLRYLSSHIRLDREIARECGEMLKSVRGRLKATDIYGNKEKTIYLAFIDFPLLYWLWRSIKEPDMWAWEKVERKKRREARKNGAGGDAV